MQNYTADKKKKKKKEEKDWHELMQHPDWGVYPALSEPSRKLGGEQMSKDVTLTSVGQEIQMWRRTGAVSHPRALSVRRAAAQAVFKRLNLSQISSFN